MVALPGFVGPSYVSQSPLADQERTVNWYMEQIEAPGGSTKSALYPVPGVNSLSEAVSGGGRAHLADSGREFAVIGSNFVEILVDGSQVSRGTVATDSNPATISSNGDAGGQLFITSGGNGYLFTLATNVLTTIAALSGLATMGDQLDGYFLSLDSETSTVYISDLLDGATWDPTQFIQRSIESDPWVALKVANRYLYLLGQVTSEVWYDAGSFPIPFEPHPSGVMQYGCAAPFSPEVVGPALVWLAATDNGQGRVMRTSGFTPEIISNYATSYAMENFSTLEDAIGDSYEKYGHTFYTLSFPQAEATWCWDSELNTWHERGEWLEEEYRFGIWRPCFHVFVFGQHRVLDLNGSGVYELSEAYGTNVDGEVIRRLRRSPGLVNENKLMFYAQFELDLEPGLGTVSGQGSDPMVMLRMSNNGGKTWGNETLRSAGRMGEYGTRVIWNRCGAARRRVFEVSVSDPIPWRVLNAYLKVSPGAEAA